MPGVWNIFAIGRERRNEDQLTEMLVWLVDAVPEVGAAITELAFGDRQIDGDLQVTSQHGVAKGRLDALFLGPGFALVVESKIDSGYGDDQIARYLEWLASTHDHRNHRGLMTLTAHPAAWKHSDVEMALQLGVAGSAHRWEELHVLLEPLAAEPDRDPLEARLIHEFLEMLGEEGLIPMKPLVSDEYQGWRDAWVTVTRFHEFFRDCKGAIGDALGATASSNSESKNAAYIWQDYVCGDGSKIVAGFNASDEEHVARSAARHTPLLWMAVEAKHGPDWAAAKDRLEVAPPVDWHLGKRWWGERPLVWRYLDQVLGEGSFEEQRTRLAQTCAVGTTWLREADLSTPRVG